MAWVLLFNVCLGYFFISFSIILENYNEVFFFSLCIHQKQHVILQLFWVMSLPHPQNKLIWSGRVWPCHAQVGCRKKAKQKSCAVLASAGIQLLRLSDATQVCRSFLLNTNQVLGFNYCLHNFFLNSGSSAHPTKCTLQTMGKPVKGSVCLQNALWMQVSLLVMVLNIKSNNENIEIWH